MQRLQTKLAQSARLLRTIRHLRTGQILNRVSRRFVRSPSASELAPPLRSPLGTWRNCPERDTSMLSPTDFRFIGEEARLDAPVDWNNPARPKLWLYNLHYFDDLRADGSEQRTEWHRNLIERWRTENPPIAGSGWDPYPLSLRIVNWIAWSLAGHRLDDTTLQSLGVQVRHLRATLEYHLLGNHLFANAKALVFAGCFFSGPEADGWLKAGLDLLAAELREQILDDGGHFELSPMYHAVILEDLLDLVQLGEIFPAELGARTLVWKTLSVRMLAWLSTMTHPDGEIAFFNDAASGIARTYGALAAYAAALDIRPTSDDASLRRLPASGYIRLEKGAFCTFLDTAEIGPSYLPGHGHADVLSLEVSFEGRRLLTNGGTSTYAPGTRRDEERATFAHGTVEIDGHSSSEVWASFRVGRRAHPFDVRCGETGPDAWAEASHDGYRWLPGRPIHRRRVEVSSNMVRIIDIVTGAGNHSVTGRFPLHPSLTSVTMESGGWRLELSGGHQIQVRVIGSPQLSVTKGYFAPTFGHRLQRPVLTWQYDGPLPLTIETRFESRRAHSPAD